MDSTGLPPGGRRVGRYVLLDEIAAGGMATVHLGRLLGDGGVARTIAIKRLHPQFAKDPDFVSMFLDEARLSARLHHPNIAAVLDFVARDGELFLVMEYLHGTTLARIWRTLSARGERMPLPIVSAIMTGVLHGLHAAHVAEGEAGASLGIVHRDVSPQNVIVGADGVPRVVDFGIAKAFNRLQTTRDGQVKGKTAYLAPEQILQREVDRRVDVYAAGVVLWELLAGLRPFQGDNEGVVLARVLAGASEPPSDHAPGLDPRWDTIALRALSLDAEDRYASAREMALAIEDACPAAPTHRLGDWVREVGKLDLARLEPLVARVERLRITEAAPTDDGAPSVLPAATALEAEPKASAPTLTPLEPASLTAAAALPVLASGGRAASSRGRDAIALAALLSLAAIGAAVWWARPAPGAAPIDLATTVAVTAPAPVASVAPAATAAVSVAPEATGLPASASPDRADSSPATSASTKRGPSPPGSAPAGGAATALRVAPGLRKSVEPRPAPGASLAPKPACEDPFVTDANGVVRVRRECL